MTLAQGIRLTELMSIILIVLGFGLRSSAHDATYLFRNARLLLRSLLAMNVLMPLFATSIVAVFALRPAIALALIALALSPVPPILPRGQLKLVARHQYIFRLFGASALLVIVLAPLTGALIGALFAQHVGIAPVLIKQSAAMISLIGNGHAFATSWHRSDDRDGDLLRSEARRPSAAAVRGYFDPLRNVARKASQKAGRQGAGKRMRGAIVPAGAK